MFGLNKLVSLFMRVTVLHRLYCIIISRHLIIKAMTDCAKAQASLLFGCLHATKSRFCAETHIGGSGWGIMISE